MLLAEIVAIVCAGLFSGAAIYVSFVEHPARIEAGLTVAVAEFGPSYRRATVMQASLAVVGSVAAVVSWMAGAGISCLVGGILLFAVVPFTVLVILPTNERLLDPALTSSSSAEASELLARWARLHAVRSFLGSVSFLLLLLPVVIR